ncbi:MAG: tRNA dihydrouridine synthase DusB [Deltaproteobacteria bacterium]|nr:tRNA dihydrouridine synthase DusB [Deltaproteobacteria bacterium]
MLKIGNVSLKNRFVMAPMAGITNQAFRLIVKRLGAGLVVTEMVSAEGLCRGHEKTFRYLRGFPGERPLSVQIFGADPETMARAAKMAVERGADLVDINMGCPARKVVRNGSGGALLRNPEAVYGIIRAVRGNCTVPLTVKIRAGWSPEEANFMEIAGIAEECGADALIVHPRFVKQGFSGKADWRVIREVKEGLCIPVIGNGDVFRPEAALRMREETGCDGVMIGRGAVGNPWIFRQILDLERGLEPREPDLFERRAVIMEHFTLLRGVIGEQRASKMMRGLLLRYTKGLPYATRFRRSFTGIRDTNTMIDAMERYFGLLSGGGTYKTGLEGEGPGAGEG